MFRCDRCDSAHNTKLDNEGLLASAWDNERAEFVPPRLTMEDLMYFERPEADKDALESALDAMDDANFSMMYPTSIQRLIRNQDHMKIDLNRFVIEDSIF